jgi:hypothetical protein
MNDLPIQMYNNALSAFMCLNGVPRNMPAARKLPPSDMEEMHAFMLQCQELAANRRKQLTKPLPVFEVGTYVNVRATPTEMRKELAIGPWTTKGVVHGVCTQGTGYYIIRWLTPGLGSRHNSKPGWLSGPVHALSLRPLLKENTKVPMKAKVFNQGTEGVLMVTHVWHGGDATYLMLTGPEEKKLFIDTYADIKQLPFTWYDLWAETVAAAAAAAEDKSLRKAGSDGKRKKQRGKKKVDSDDEPLGRRARKKKAKKGYKNPRAEPNPATYSDPSGGFVFVGSDDPEGIWSQASAGKRRVVADLDVHTYVL